MLLPQLKRETVSRIVRHLTGTHSQHQALVIASLWHIIVTVNLWVVHLTETLVVHLHVTQSQLVDLILGIRPRLTLVHTVAILNQRVPHIRVGIVSHLRLAFVILKPVPLGMEARQARIQGRPVSLRPKLDIVLKIIVTLRR